MRTLSIVLFPLVSIMLGCSEDEPIDIADESTETGDDEADEGADAMGPTVEIMLDGDPLSPTIRSAGTLQLRAEAHDPSGVDAVEFYLDDVLLSVDASEPYTASLMIPDASFNGERSLIARAYDSSGNMAESSMPLSIALPEHGSVEWEYIGPGSGPRWVLVGPQDSAFVIDQHKLLHISAEGSLLSSYEFTYDVAAVTQDEDGPIALGAIDGTLVIQRFSNEGVPLFLDLIEDFGSVDMSISDVALGDGRLVVSSVSINPAYGEDTARISSVTYEDEVALEWNHFLNRQGQATDLGRDVPVAVAPSGAIYTTPTFDAALPNVYLQLRGLDQVGQATSTYEHLINYRSGFNDIVATDDGVYVAAGLNDIATIVHFNAGGVPIAIYFTSIGDSTVLEAAGDELIYASLSYGHTRLGRISADGAERWATQLGGDDIVQDIAVTSVGHLYVVSEWDQDAWRLRRIHP